MPYDLIQGQSQGHKTLKVWNSLIFKIRVIHHLQCCKTSTKESTAVTCGANVFAFLFTVTFLNSLPDAKSVHVGMIKFFLNVVWMNACWIGLLLLFMDSLYFCWSVVSYTEYCWKTGYKVPATMTWMAYRANRSLCDWLIIFSHLSDRWCMCVNICNMYYRERWIWFNV